MMLFLIIFAIIGWALAISAFIFSAITLVAYASCIANANESQKPLLPNNKWQKN